MFIRKIFSAINSDPEDDLEDNGTAVAVATAKPKLKKPPLYRVIIFNDDFTPMEFVVYVLQIFFGIDGDKATQIMLEVHTHGKGVCGIFTKEVAETKSSQVNNYAKESEHPLISEIEPVDEE
jgi:ATP-dependent Clp protease adaptor protein ClpS